MNSEEFKKYLEHRAFRESLCPSEDYSNVSENEALISQHKAELAPYAAYTEYSSFYRYVSDKTPNLSLYTIYDIPDTSIVTKKKSRFADFFRFNSKELLWSFAFLILVVCFSSWLKERSFIGNENRVSATTGVILSADDCMFRERTAESWRIADLSRKCRLFYSSSFGRTEFWVFPNTDLTIKVAGADRSDLETEILKGKVYLKETSTKKNGTKLKVGSWNVQLTGTHILLDYRNQKAYFTLLEGSAESEYIVPETGKQIRETLSRPGETMEFESKLPQVRKISLTETQLKRLVQNLEKRNTENEAETDASRYFRNETKTDPSAKDAWVIHLKDGRVVKGRIETEYKKIIVYTKTGREVFDEEEVVSVSK
ncbi:hypothetical protein EHQ12_01690 [Leptospira gomenensis]|uniref:FecR protein domain-containing protein n=1 Tax=Leptospira gomenensis TaxID=2484974 RepID=A0A5F1YA54_9LEPT|nr:hypothetical protein [Leptospira gomenensis]TGK31779.1 hypothetical protein EHQ17_13445 [Leptospira gomenensis]TGK41593.1 hypothetical protein EHQ07_16030 [Leptospira gomenensis]TGK44426.1 hypothetical protein EHQ12_01690 [Leptospira gomenensis]TGK61447.1 hypothetical protein EHQ13_08835 [Leptospira gomenensis]